MADEASCFDIGVNKLSNSSTIALLYILLEPKSENQAFLLLQWKGEMSHYLSQ